MYGLVGSFLLMPKVQRTLHGWGGGGCGAFSAAACGEKDFFCLKQLNLGE